MLSVLERPQKDLTYYISNWNGAGGRLPVQYKIESDLFPVNNADPVFTISSVVTSGGYALFNVTASTTFNRFDWVAISGTTKYNGVYQIIDVVSATQLVLDLAYNGTDTGSLQKYYKNYKALVRVYAGIPSYHALNPVNPMSLVATMSLDADINNIVTVDVSGLIKEAFNADFNTDTNDTNRWTSFYIEYAEQYDVSDGDEVATFTDTFTTDEYENCGGEKVTNGTFTGGLTGWTQTGSGNTWISGGSDATVLDLSQKLEQSITVYPDVPYTFAVDAYCDVNNSKLNIKARYSTGEITLFSIGIVNYTPTTFTFTDVYFKEATFDLIFEVVAITASPVVTIIDNVTLQAEDCTAYLFGIFGVQQFQNALGGNFGRYVANFNNGAFENKFLTQFATPIIFDNQHFDLSIIIPSSSFGGAVDGNVYAEVNKYNGSTYVGREDITLTGQNDGVYRVDLSTLDLTGVDNVTCRLYRLPYSVLYDGDSGTFEFTTDVGGNPPSDWNMSLLSTFPLANALNYSTDFPRTGTGCLVYAGVSDAQTYNGLYQLFSFDTPMPCDTNKVYKIGAWVRNSNTTDAFSGNTPILFKPVGNNSSYTLNDLLSYDTYTLNGPVLLPYTYIETVFNTGNNTSFTVECLANFNNVTISAVGVMSMYIDDVQVLGALEYLSELKPIEVNTTCYNQSLPLAWLNNLGGWEYFTFTAEKDYGVEANSSVEFKRDIFADFDDSFINGQTETDFLDIESYWSVRVRSQLLTLDQVKAIGGDRTTGSAGIVNALRVVDLSDPTKPVTVKVNKQSVNVRKDKQKMYYLEFNIMYPRIEIQNQ